ncbi:MAG: LLM class flavin-dependent oxidoreductase [Myxococcota bacterium]|nr:LLM class flavin-dependent oxidoreductase [Myxococcota bacterium]
MTRERVRFGLWYDFRHPAPRAESFESFYSSCLEQIAWAEELGFESVWLTEHHFCEDGYTPSPLVIAGAIAARTRSMRIGTNLMLLPIADPIRVAEDAAAVSILSGGRFDLGVGLGYRQLEFDEFKVPIRNRPSRMEEGVEIIRRAWRGEPIRFSGRRFEIGDVAVGPVPEHPPRILMGGMSEPAIHRAARIGDGFLSTGGIGHDIYRAALAAEGRSGEIFAGHWAIISPDPEAEARKLEPHILYQANNYIDWGAFGPPGEVPRFPTGKDALNEGLYECWDANTAIKELTRFLRDSPEIRDVHFWAQFPGEPVESGSRRIQYMASEVLPEVRKALEISGES